MTIKKILLCCSLMMLAACGTIATPVYEAPAATPTEAPATATQGGHGHAHAAAPTTTPVPPTATLPPVTEVLTDVPTAVPTDIPTQAAVNDPIKFFVDLASAANGENIFHNIDFETDTGIWRCTTCHNTEGDVIKIGPSLWGIPDRAGTRIEGQGTYTYLYNSIRNAHDFIVPGFENATHMPHFTPEQLSDAQIYDLIAYLMTLR